MERLFRGAISGVWEGGDVEIFVPRGTFLEASCAEEYAGLSVGNWDWQEGGELRG